MTLSIGVPWPPSYESPALPLPAPVNSGAKQGSKSGRHLTGVQFLESCPDLICNPICYLVSPSPYQHFRFQCAFSRLNICVFNYVTLGELPFHCSRSNLELLFPAHTACPFPLHPFGGSFSIVTGVPRSYLYRVSSVNLIMKLCPIWLHFIPWHKCSFCIHSRQVPWALKI